jgi:hypothetical protein
MFVVQVRWQGFGAASDSWEPQSNIESTLIQNFNLQMQEEAEMRATARDAEKEEEEEEEEEAFQVTKIAKETGGKETRRRPRLGLFAAADAVPKGQVKGECSR